MSRIKIANRNHFQKRLGHDHEEEDDEEKRHPLLPLISISNRTIKLFGEVNDGMSFHVWNFLKEMETAASDEPVKLIINSPGGNVHDMFSIVDAIKTTSCPVITVGTGLIASAATLILAAGDKGQRFLSPNCTVMIHEISWGAYSSLTDIKMVVEEAQRLEDSYQRLLGEFTGKSVKAIASALASNVDNWLSAKDAIKKIGLADKILTKLP